MIRRAFWLTVGVVGGIIGYRRAESLGRRLSETLASSPARRQRRHPPDDAAASPEQPARPPRLATASAVLAGRAGVGVVRGTVRLTRDARSFSRDVREGMDEYLTRHSGRETPTLGASRGSADHEMNAKDDH